MKVLDAIQKRRSTHSFISKRVTLTAITDILEAAVQGPFAGNINNLKIIIITDDQKKKESLARYADQLWIAEADTILVVCSDNSHIVKQYDSRGEMYAQQQTGAAIQNMLLTLTEKGIASCWVGAFLESGIKKTLSIPEHIAVEALIPIGYTKEKTKAPRKTRIENIMFWETWGASKKPSFASDPLTR